MCPVPSQCEVCTTDKELKMGLILLLNFCTSQCCSKGLGKLTNFSEALYFLVLNPDLRRVQSRWLKHHYWSYNKLREPKRTFPKANTTIIAGGCQYRTSHVPAHSPHRRAMIIKLPCLSHLKTCQTALVLGQVLSVNRVRSHLVGIKRPRTFRDREISKSVKA